MVESLPRRFLKLLNMAMPEVEHIRLPRDPYTEIFAFVQKELHGVPSLIANNLETLRRSPTTMEHLLYSGLIAGHLYGKYGFSQDEGALAGYLHDIGKVGNPKIPKDTSILDLIDLPRRLNVAELTIVRRHARYSFDILNQSGLSNVAKEIVAHHEFQAEPYERVWQRDNPLNNPELHVQQLFVAIADKITASAVPRPYHEHPETSPYALKKEILDRLVFSGGPNIDYIISDGIMFCQHEMSLRVPQTLNVNQYLEQIHPALIH